MNFDLLVDLHQEGDRQGPGSEAHTELAISLSGLLENSERLRIADIGCGSGASTLVLAENLNADISAVDLFPQFLNILKNRAKDHPSKSHIETLQCSMDQLPFRESSLDAVWSEGAIYNMGFEKGVAYFKRFLKPGGIMALSEITWLTQNRPNEITTYWRNEYPEIATAAEKIRILEEQGFMIKGYFPLPESCWLENYYEPLQNRFEAFLSRHDSEEARAIIEAEIGEIELYEKYRAYYSYGFYVAQKTSD